MTSIPIENITPNGNNRKNAGELTLIPSIKTDGILEPIIVYKDKGDKGFKIAAGHRRYASALAYGIDKIPCIVLPKEKAIRAACIENIDRENLSPADLAESILTMYTDCGYCVDDIAAVTRLSKNQVARILRLKNCIPEVQEALKEGKFTLEIALEYAPYNEDIQKAVYKDYHELTWSKAKNIREALNRRVGSPLKDYSDEFINTTLGCNTSCLSCEHNLACDGVLFADGVNKEESVCTCTENRIRKYVEMAKSLGLRYQNIEELKDFGYEPGITESNHGKEEPTNYIDYEKGLNRYGEICYFGGSYVYPSYQKREMSEKEKDLRESLRKEEDWLKVLMEDVETHIGKNLYKSFAETLVKALEPFDDDIKKTFESIIDESLLGYDASTMDLETKIIKAMFNDKPGRLYATAAIAEIKRNKDIKKLFKKYTDYMIIPPLNNDAYKLCLVAENIRNYQKEIDEESKK